MFFLEISELNANSVDPDQTPRSAASELGLYCSPMSLLWDARLKRVKPYRILIHVTCIFRIAGTDHIKFS